MKKLLGIFAHPDDETIEAGGTIAKYVKAGWSADIVVATRGENGTRGSVDILEGKTLADVRSHELTKSAEILGIRSISFLDYIDGTLSQKTPGDIEDQLVRILHDIRPDVVITAEPEGLTNHPDHIKLSYSATYAFQEYAKLRESENTVRSDLPKLYYACFPQSIMTYLVEKGCFSEEAHGKKRKGTEDKRITTVIDIRRFAGKKVMAMDAHQTQRELLEKYVRIQNNPFFIHEYFIHRMTGTVEVFIGKTESVSGRL